MAKRKRRRVKKEKIVISIELYAILWMIIAILGIGKLGPVGKMIASFSLFLTGSIYLVVLLLVFIIAIYAFFKREWPEFFSTKMFGFYLFAIGLLTFMHWNFVSLNEGNSSLIFKETMEQLLKGFNSIMSTGALGEANTVGGGIIGGLFAIAFAKLFSYTGMQIVTITFIVVGISMFTGFSIVDFIRDRVTYVKENHKEDDDDEEPDNNKKQVKISNGIEVEEVDKQVVKNIEELKKLQSQNQEETIKEEQATTSQQAVINPSYKLPPLDILNKPKNKSTAIDNSAIEANIEKLENVLKSFGVMAKVVEVHVGPTVAQYELEIATGTRVNKITTLNREIALALSKKDVRIEAPIPGKNTVGVEFANDQPTSVSFYEIMDSKEMRQNPDKWLTVPLGRSIMGEIGLCEINKMPHLLIAGTTGSGKSVCVNGII